MTVPRALFAAALLGWAFSLIARLEAYDTTYEVGNRVIPNVQEVLAYTLLFLVCWKVLR